MSVLRDKIVDGKKSLKEVYGSPLYGIKTGLNDAFVVDSETRDRLVSSDPKSTELLKPFLEGKDIKRWRAESRGLWLIYIPKNRINIDDFPAIRDWLLPFKEKLEKRATKQEWYELQQAQEAYSEGYMSPRVFYAHFNRRYFFYTRGSFLPNDKGYVIPTADSFLCALLNSNVLWFVISDLAPQVIGGSRELRSHYMETLPIPLLVDEQRTVLSELTDRCHKMAASRQKLQLSLVRRIPDLCPPDREAKLTGKLENWHELPDFAAFRAEVKKCLKADIPVKERSDWEDLFVKGKAEIEKLSAEIKRNEDEINAIVYKLFDLTPDEIALLEESIGVKKV